MVYFPSPVIVPGLGNITSCQSNWQRSFACLGLLIAYMWSSLDLYLLISMSLSPRPFMWSTSRYRWSDNPHSTYLIEPFPIIAYARSLNFRWYCLTSFSESSRFWICSLLLFPWSFLCMVCWCWWYWRRLLLLTLITIIIPHLLADRILCTGWTCYVPGSL